MEAITKAELARRLEVSRPRVTQLCHAGMPTLPDGRVDSQAALSWVASHVDRSRDAGRVRKPALVPAPASVRLPSVDTTSPTMQPGGNVLDPARALLIARARKAVVETKRIERLEKVAAGEVFEGEKVREFIREVSYLVRDHVLAQAGRLSGAVAATKSTEEIYRLISQDSHAMLIKLSKAIESLSIA
jgi:hypothetical protein